jgi:predicted transcriptional regulator
MRPAHGIAGRDVDYLVALVTGHPAGLHEANDIVFGATAAQGRRCANRLAAYGLIDIRRRSMGRQGSPTMLVRATDAGRALVAAMQLAQSLQSAIQNQNAAK